MPTPPAVSTSATTNTPVAAPVTDLRITKTNGVDGVVAGQPTTYTITITNTAGPSDAIGATVTDTVPGDADRRDVDVHGHGRRRVPRVGQRQHQHVRDRAGRRDRRLHRHRHGRSRGHRRPRQLGPGAPARGPRQPDLGDRHRQRPDHRRAPTWASPRRARRPSSPGNPLVYTITVTNSGPSDAAGVVVSDATPTGLVFVSNTGDCTTAFPCALGVVPAGATRTITATFTVPITYPGLGPIVNVASVSATTPDADRGEQHGHRRDDAESRCGRGDQ